MTQLTVEPRHIQNYSDAAQLEPHWGYADRVLPCTNDAGSCEYLDVVYHAHDVGMLYTGIIWATIGGILLIWTLFRRFNSHPSPEAVIYAGTGEDVPSSASARKASFFNRLTRSITVASRRYLLPNSWVRIFGHTTRLQVAVLLALAGYLTIWTFLGITYKKWITPVRNSPGVYNTRTSLGPWADRIGVLAYAMLPLSIMLSSRESLLSLLTGIPYQHFLFLHRWLGYIILVQSILHTIGWTIIEARLYQPQPSVAQAWIKQKYMVWGCVAILLLCIMFVLSLPMVIRRTGYEFFRKMHYVVAMLFIGACWGHWEHLKCFLLPSLLLWFLDRAARIVRTGLIHYQVLPSSTKNEGVMGFQAIQTNVQLFRDQDEKEKDSKGDVVRLDLDASTAPAAEVGQHLFLCFLEGSIWQSHPFTPVLFSASRSSFAREKDGFAREETHSYIFRAKSGETKKIAQLAARKLSEQATDQTVSTKVIMTGPYGSPILEDLEPSSNVLCVAGGTGITFVLPVFLHLLHTVSTGGNMNVELVWVVRKRQDVEWIRPELEFIEQQLRFGGMSQRFRVSIFVTRDNRDEESVAAREKASLSSSSSSTTSSPAKESASTSLHHNVSFLRPNLPAVLSDFLSRTASGSTTVFASGPTGMTAELRFAVAQANKPGPVWRGEDQGEVKLVCDDRAEW